MADIFISYARENLAAAERLAQVLTAYGWSVWWDRHIPAGRRFDKVIAEQLSSASCVLVLWSRNVIDSEWVMEEAETARTSGTLVPVMIEAAQPPIGFRRIHAADLIGWDGSINHPPFEQLLIDITNVISSQRHRPATVARQPLPETAREPVPPPRLEKSGSIGSIADAVGDPGVRSAEMEAVAAPQDGTAGLDTAALASSAIEATWHAAAIQAIENQLAHFIGPVAKVVVSRAMRDVTDLGSLHIVLANSISFDADRERFLIWAKNLGLSAPLPASNSGGNTATPLFESTSGTHDLLITDANLRLIEQALARYIGPIVKVILKRAMAQSATRNDLCEHLAKYIEREDERRQFLATVTRWI